MSKQGLTYRFRLTYIPNTRNDINLSFRIWRWSIYFSIAVRKVSQSSDRGDAGHPLLHDVFVGEATRGL